MDAWRRKTPRGQLGFPKTRFELRDLKEFTDRQVRCDQWKKSWLWKTRVEERIQFTRSDEARNERVGGARPMPIYAVGVCISSFPDEEEE